jgi:hypothetical protein
LVREGFDFGPAFESLVEYARKIGWRSFEFRGGPFAEGAPFTNASYYEHRLSLEAESKPLDSRFRSTTRRNVKKAREAGVRVSFSNSEEALGEYYRLHCLSRKHHGVPPQPYAFFRAILAICGGGSGTMLWRSIWAGTSGGRFICVGRTWRSINLGRWIAGGGLDGEILVMAEAFVRFWAEGVKEIG